VTAPPRAPRTTRGAFAAGGSSDLPLRVPGDPWLYAFARVLLVGAVRAYGRFQAEGAGELPVSGPAMVVANHPSDVDPILLAVSFPRTLHFMADVVQFRRGFVGPVIRRLAAFPIDKGSADRRGLETALELLRRGEVVALFPEGDLHRQAEPEPFGPGIGFLAAHSGAPVIPVCITGAERIWDGRRVHRPCVTLRVGPGLRFDGALGPGGAPVSAGAVGSGGGPGPHGRGNGRRGREAYLRFAEQTRAAVVRLRDGGSSG
jgi:1-acyl-sn-glycerol-3-phosphate acyltransferase